MFEVRIRISSPIKSAKIVNNMSFKAIVSAFKRVSLTVENVSVFGVILVRIQPKCLKMQTRITPNTDFFMQWLLRMSASKRLQLIPIIHLGAFLIPYFIMMVIEGIPLFYIEFAVGQRFRRSAIGCWKKMHPALMGVGISCVVISMLLCIYYISVIAWCFYYFFVSFTSKLPWRLENCPE